MLCCSLLPGYWRYHPSNQEPKLPVVHSCCSTSLHPNFGLTADQLEVQGRGQVVVEAQGEHMQGGVCTHALQSNIVITLTHFE